ncbi:MAG: DUF4062 domain-containing protein [Acidimicrobiales bacterium]
MSSTLAEERAAVARAITSLRLTPVMFELGARPHPPRELNRAYLAQSDIFVGLYWQRYGWVAPRRRRRWNRGRHRRTHRLARRARDGLDVHTVTELVVGSPLRFDDRGAHKLKGVDGHWHLFAVGPDAAS